MKRNYLKMSLSLVAMVLFLTNCDAQKYGKVSGDGNVISETRDVGNFDNIGVSGSFDVNLVKGNEGKIEIQLKKGVTQTEDLKVKFTNALLKYVDADLEIKLYHYQDFPYGMELDYERKFKCI